MNEWTHSDTTDQGDDPPDELDMTTRDHEADDQLIALIGRTLRHYESPPADVVAAARGAVYVAHDRRGARRPGVRFGT